MKKFFLLTVTAVCLIVSCDTMQQVSGSILQSKGITNADNVAGLKDALSVGIGNAVVSLGKQDGYFANQALKILLPPEAAIIVDNIKLIPGGQSLVEDVVLRLNRAAEDAVSEAAPIFGNAIKNMTISDATNILFGNKDAATAYLQKNTYNQLVSAYAPKINNSLGKNIVGGISAANSWGSLTSAYNSVANSVVGKVANLTPVNEDLGAYVTGKALDGLFLTLANEEAKIREDPVARVNDLLKKVFGQLDKQR
ncbi:MAG: DUF4197 domain-containing protein [Bacteroidales bacterium]|nr:DUF4197 domain-containing protein [Bacteroidales bacterium]MCL2133286.1 DUF4197 domain-containing protein [Bacteroidales bacterium]